MEKVIAERELEPPHALDQDHAEVYGASSQAYDAKAVHQLLQSYRVNQLKLAKSLIVECSSKVRDVISAMQAAKSGCVVTQKDGKIDGIFTERDLLKKVIDEPLDWDQPIEKFTTKNPVTMKDTDPVRKALYLMRKKNFRHIPIFNEQNELLGVLSVRNIIRLFSEHFPQEVINLPPKLNHVPETPEGG